MATLKAGDRMCGENRELEKVDGRILSSVV